MPRRSRDPSVRRARARPGRGSECLQPPQSNRRSAACHHQAPSGWRPALPLPPRRASGLPQELHRRRSRTPPLTILKLDAVGYVEGDSGHAEGRRPGNAPACPRARGGGSICRSDELSPGKSVTTARTYTSRPQGSSGRLPEARRDGSTRGLPEDPRPGARTLVNTVRRSRIAVAQVAVSAQPETASGRGWRYGRHAAACDHSSSPMSSARSGAPRIDREVANSERECSSSE